MARPVLGACLLALAGLAAGGAFAQDIAVGHIAAFGTRELPEASELRDGARACFEQANRAGGAKGRRIDFFALDDELDPARFDQRLEEAMARRPVALVLPIGSATLGHLLQARALDTHDLVVMGAVPGAEVFREPGHPRLFHIRAGDRLQLERLLEHSRTLGLERLHVVNQDLAVGTSGLAVVQATAQRLGGLTITASTAAHEAASLKEAVRLAAAAPADAYVLVGYPMFMAEALAKALHGMGEVDFGGFRIRFGDGQVGSTWTDIGVVSESGRLMY